MDEDRMSVVSDTTESPETSDGADRVKVAVRVRPFTDAEKASGTRCIISMKENSTDVLDPTFFSGDGSVDPDHYTRRFNFDHSFWSHLRSADTYATQELVFNALGEFLLGNALRGYNCSLFAYGQTGSGKTYTMLGMEGGSIDGSSDLSEVRRGRRGLAAGRTRVGEDRPNPPIVLPQSFASSRSAAGGGA